jgi:energy-converting hydrogenase Eha subunit F
MNQERNIMKSIMSMSLDITGFMKDNMNMRKDLATLYDRPLPEAKTNAKENMSRT